MRIPHNALIIASGAIAALTLVAGTAIAADVFSDVRSDHWARQYIEWANDNHVMTGPGGQDRAFEPDRPVSRAEMAAVSYRMYIRMEQEINALSQRIVELEAKMDMMGHSTSSSSSSSSSMSSTSSSSSSSMTSSSSSMSSGMSVSSSDNTATNWLGFPTDRSRRLLMTAGLSGSEVVPSVSTNGRGNVNLRWTSDGLCYEAGVSGITNTVTGLRFYRGNRNEQGTLLKSFTFTTADRAQGCWPSLTSDEWQSFLDNNVYAVVTTQEHPEGEIRGQINFRR
jgi:hypothetical protein